MSKTTRIKINIIFNNVKNYDENGLLSCWIYSSAAAARISLQRLGAIARCTIERSPLDHTSVNRFRIESLFLYIRVNIVLQLHHLFLQVITIGIQLS